MYPYVRFPPSAWDLEEARRKQTDRKTDIRWVSVSTSSSSSDTPPQPGSSLTSPAVTFLPPSVPTFLSNPRHGRRRHREQLFFFFFFFFSPPRSLFTYASPRSSSPVGSRGSSLRRSPRRIPGARRLFRTVTRALDAMERRRRSVEELELPPVVVVAARGQTNKTQAHLSSVRPLQPEEQDRGESATRPREIFLFLS